MFTPTRVVVSINRYRQSQYVCPRLSFFSWYWNMSARDQALPPAKTSTSTTPAPATSVPTSNSEAMKTVNRNNPSVAFSVVSHPLPEVPSTGARVKAGLSQVMTYISFFDVSITLWNSHGRNTTLSSLGDCTNVSPRYSWGISICIMFPLPAIQNDWLIRTKCCLIIITIIIVYRYYYFYYIIIIAPLNASELCRPSAPLSFIIIIIK